MSGQTQGTWKRPVLFSLAAALLAGSIFIIVSLLTGATWDASTVLGGVVTAAVTWVVAVTLYALIQARYARRSSTDER